MTDKSEQAGSEAERPAGSACSPDKPDTVAIPEAAGGSLTGFRIGVTSDRRSEDLIDALERRGAEVLHAPVLKIAPIAEDAELVRETQELIAARPDYLLVTTAYGMRRWVESADAHGQGDELTEVLENASIYVRGPKARGAVRAAGFTDDGISEDERTSTLVDSVLELGVDGRTVAIQMHGYADLDDIARLQAAGATVLTVSPYRWVVPEGSAEKVEKLIDAVIGGGLDVVTFTAAPAVDALWSAAHERGRYWELVRAFQTNVVAATVGPVTAQPLQDVGIEPLVPERFRMGAMIRQVVEYLSDRGTQRCATAFGELSIRGSQVTLGGETTELGSSQLALFRAIADAQGAVLSRADLIGILPEGQGDHALDMAVSRLRQSLPNPKLVATVIKRGYRLNV
ncbi:uroporphyrinogen-III synthase [Zhihengliuella salsuginis]|uniref:Uroporphyrinogen-III synthase n=1 Tax=Zhihengliuella salsuginis TaxID=578222 RepID=A0ABQ3GHD6_9MICC|nr:uroporphyrinogen-III synthase [Zhihengliuella salsuginis]GHD06758.1 uroporphyrinogen-III synthase [Zhihengliuella salsuginis]